MRKIVLKRDGEWCAMMHQQAMRKVEPIREEPFPITAQMSSAPDKAWTPYGNPNQGT